MQMLDVTEHQALYWAGAHSKQKKRTSRDLRSKDLCRPPIPQPEWVLPLTSRAEESYNRPGDQTGRVTFLKSLRRLSSIMGSNILRTDPWLSCQRLYTAQQKPFVTKQTKTNPLCYSVKCKSKVHSVTEIVGYNLSWKCSEIIDCS